MDYNFSPPASDQGSDDDDYATDVMDDGSESEDMETHDFDRNLPTTHSYLPGGLVTCQGRSVLEEGWTGRVPCWAHHSVVFPGETVPMLFTDLADTLLLQNVIDTDKLFGLLFIGGERTQTYGVLCEVTEAAHTFNERNLMRNPFTFKARARQRFVVQKSSEEQIRNLPSRIEKCNIKILPDILMRDPLQDVRFFSIGRHRNSPKTPLNESLRKIDAVFSPWPHFVYDRFDEQRIISHIKEYFRELELENLPMDTLSLSYWVATNLTLPVNERLALFMTDNVLLRLYLESDYIEQKSRKYYCTTCLADICSKDDVFAMSNEGIYSNYCNIGGFVHDIMTVRTATHVTLQGRPSIKFTWFPGYLWTIASCASCSTHVGWRFNANKKTLRPQEFWGLARKALTTQNIPKPD